MLASGRGAGAGDDRQPDRGGPGRRAGALTLERLGLDPALASGTFVTTLTDVMGFFAFLGLATVMLL
jgi:hypothetical protein